MQVDVINPVLLILLDDKVDQAVGRLRLQSGSRSSAFAGCQGGAPAPAVQAS